MGIPVTIFPSPALAHHLNTDVRTGRRRKEPLDLSRCALLEMQQWDCQIVGQVIQCRSIDRLFRRCKDAASGKNITIEVTGVETPPWKDGTAT